MHSEEAERVKYAIRIPTNQVLQNRIGYLLKRPVRTTAERRSWRYYANLQFRRRRSKVGLHSCPPILVAWNFTILVTSQLTFYDFQLLCLQFAANSGPLLLLCNFVHVNLDSVGVFLTRKAAYWRQNIQKTQSSIIR